MNHNPHNLKEMQTVILDKGWITASEVIIIFMTEKALYSRVMGLNDSPSDSWEVMTSRLSPLN